MNSEKLSNFEIREINDKKKWASFLDKSPKKSFLQTWEWGEFQSEGLGKNIYRLGLWEEDTLSAINLCIEEKSRFGTYIYSPRGPIFDWDKNAQIRLKAFTMYWGAKHQYINYRSDPFIKHDSKHTQIFEDCGFRNAANFVQVQHCWVVDLDGVSNEKELYERTKEMGMSKSVPRHIRKSAKNGVTSRISDDIEDIDLLLEYLNNLAEDKGIPKRADKYYKKMFKYLAPAGIMKLVISEHEGNPVSAMMISSYGDQVATLHGASKRGLSTSLYVGRRIYWDAMLFAVKNGFKRFNFWGVLSEDKMQDKSHPSYGYSLFKKRFGGREIFLMNTKDYVFKPLNYWLLYLQEKYRKFRFKVD
jgi:lipid II:glycine glycyltransferase (peptidoglycan interpeptide bridge formation enzyme)